MTLSAAAADGDRPIEVVLPAAHRRRPGGAIAVCWRATRRAALTALLARCVQRIGPHDDHRTRSQIAGAVRALASAEIEAAHGAAGAEGRRRRWTPRCAECGRAFTAPFDVQRFFFGELRTDATCSTSEVHYLAYHYHWSEREIMAMTRDKRQKYIDVLADAIEVLNGGA